MRRAYPAGTWRVAMGSLVLLGGSIILAGFQSSTTGCPTPKYFGQQWPQSSTVYYDTSGLDAAQKSAADQALKDWNTANQTNGSGVVFSPATAQNPANLIFSNKPATIPGTSETCTPGPNQGALTCASAATGTQNTLSAAIVFNPSATIANSTDPVFDPEASHYGTFLQKVLRHEIGHT